MTRKISKHIFIFLTVLLLQTTSLSAEMFTFEDINFTLDIPEGCELTDASKAGDSFLFETKMLPVKFALKFYSQERYKNPEDMISDIAKQLGSNKASTEKYNWYGRPVNISTFQFVMSDQKLYSAWALAFQVSLKDNPAINQNVLMLTYADAQISRDCEQFMLSILDSIFLCREDFRRPGPVTMFGFSNTENIEVIMNIGGKSIISTQDVNAVERSKFVLDREFAVLKIYAKSPKWKEAWQRYYRQIFRESYNSFDTVSNDIYKALLPQAQKANFAAPNIEIIQMLLDWVQDMEYQRDHKNADFTVPAAVIQGSGCDCDSRSMLMCIILEHFGINTELFISREYSHAVFGADVKQNGAAIKVDGVNYVLGETTAKVSFGLIAQDQSDTKKWIEVDLP